VNLPCRVFCGPESALELSGTALSIDTGSLVLALTANGSPHPAMGERVRLELSLPVSDLNGGARYLAVRARVASVAQMDDGSQRFTMTFRKPSFKERVDVASRKPPKAAAKGWAM
jgi:hypothetical protein